jgi:hypothetical protein
MRYERLTRQDVYWLDNQPETAMGLHVVIVEHPSVQPEYWSTVLYILGGQVVVDVSYEEAEGEDDADWTYRPEVGRSRPQGPLLDERWMREGSPAARADYFGAWLDGLPTRDLPDQGRRVLTSRPVPYGSYGPPPSPGASTFGHLPYKATARGDEVFYRWEPFPRSRRVNQATGDISPGTYCAPASEVPFVPTGFAAVGRFALPNLSPANWRWEIRPTWGTSYRCGASVPLYGQSGGGVEASFPTGFTNVGPIANPVVLPAL